MYSSTMSNLKLKTIKSFKESQTIYLDEKFT